MARHLPPEGLPLAGQVRQKTSRPEGAGGFHHGAPGTDPAGGAGSDTPQAPGGFPPAPPQPDRARARTHRGRGARRRAAHGPGPHHGRRVAPSRRPRRGGPAAPRRRGAPAPCVVRCRWWWGGVKRSLGEKGGASRLPAGPTAPTPRRTGDPPWVFKPPRRDALGTWRGGRRARRGGWGWARGAPTLTAAPTPTDTLLRPRPPATRGGLGATGP